MKWTPINQIASGALGNESKALNYKAKTNGNCGPVQHLQIFNTGTQTNMVSKMEESISTCY